MTLIDPEIMVSGRNVKLRINKCTVSRKACRPCCSVLQCAKI